MPRYQPVQILGGCYQDDNRSWSLQDTVNWLPEQAEQSETRTPTQFKTPPGLRPFLEIPSTGGGEDPVIPSKPVRGTYNCENKLFAAIGKTLYQITNSGVAIPQGTIPGNTRVTMTHNQISQGNQLVAVNGSSGYVFNTLTQVYEKIVDAGFPGAIWVGFADGYILGVEPGRRFAFNSEPADALNYNTLDRFTSEYKPDLIVTGIVNNNELILLNETSYEFFENTGATQQPFRSKRIYGDVGCASRFGAANLDRTVFMFGADGKFYRLEGYNWIRISTRPIEQAIRGLNWSQCFTTVWEDSGHSVVRWTFPDGMTWCFDQSTQLWHRMKSLGLDRYRISTSTQLGQDWYCGDFQSGRIWVMDWDYILEGEDEIESERVTGVLSDNQNLAVVNRLELLFATGQQLTVPVPFPEQPDPPVVELSLPDGNVGVSWPGGTAIGSSGTPPYSYSSRPGTSFPGNLGPMSAAGVIAAEVPTTVGLGTVVVRVTDSNGLYAETTETFQIAMLLPWIMSASFTDVKDVKPSIDGLVWTAAGINGPHASSYYRDGTEFLSVGTGTDCGWVSTDPLAGSWTSIGIDLESGTLGPSRAAKAGDNWYIASSTYDTWKYDGVSSVSVGIPSWTLASIQADAGDTIFSTGFASSTDVVIRDEDFVSTDTVTFRASGSGVALIAGDGKVAIAWGDVTAGIHISSTDVTGVLNTHSNPFPGTWPTQGCIGVYSKGLGLWALVVGTRVAYGPTLDELTLSAHVFSHQILGIAEDGTRITIVGQDTLCETTLDGNTWTPLTVSNTGPTTALEAIIAINNTEDP